MTIFFSFILALLLFTHLAPPATWAADNFKAYEDCLLKTIQTATDTLSVSDVKKICTEKITLSKQEECAEATKLCEKPKTQENQTGIAFHNPTYLLASYNSNPSGKGLGLDDNEIDLGELKYQLSFKVPIPIFKTTSLFNGETGQLFAAYTMKSFWQILNGEISRPFRETNHEPEIFYDLNSNQEYFGFQCPVIRIGFSHQSNGRGGEFSRSWNRLYLDFILPRGDFTFHVKPWYRLPEKPEEYKGDPYGDDNSNISSYMGYGELSGHWKINSCNTMDIMLRNNHNRGAVELDWTFPWFFWHLSEKSPIKGYLQYFNGYGESMIDYNSSVNRIGLGIRLID
jgi:phospholipase A1